MAKHHQNEQCISNLVALINRSTSSGRRYLRDCTLTFLGRRELSAFWRAVMCLTISVALNPLSSFLYNLSVKESFYGMIEANAQSELRLL